MTHIIHSPMLFDCFFPVTKTRVKNRELSYVTTYRNTYLAHSSHDFCFRLQNSLRPPAVIPKHKPIERRKRVIVPRPATSKFKTHQNSKKPKLIVIEDLLQWYTTIINLKVNPLSSLSNNNNLIY